jgi:branched-chain amino acid transport system ATP-binding protein
MMGSLRVEMQNDIQGPLLRISNADVFHGTFQALWDVSLDVKAGEIVGLIGANTSGKSTLLDAISGLLHPAKGKIEFDGHDISNMDPFQIVELGITQVPEGRGVFPDMSVLDNLILGSYNRKARSRKEENLKNVYQHFPILGENAQWGGAADAGPRAGLDGGPQAHAAG